MIGRSIVLSLVVVAGMGAMSATADLPDGATQRSETEEFALPNGYKAVLEHTITALPDDPDRWIVCESSLSIVRGGVVLHRIDDVVTIGCSGLWMPARNEGEEPLLHSIDQDVTGNGIPDLVVREYSGGAHCCTTTYIFELAKDHFVAFEPIDQGHSTGRESFVQADDDPALEIRTCDWRFAYWKMSFAESPVPDVLLDLRENRSGKSQWVFANRKKALSVVERKRLMAHAEALGNSPRAPTEFPEFPEFLTNVLDLIYSGNADFAREYTRASFKGHEEKHVGFLIELGIIFDARVYSDCGQVTEGILKLNNCETIGELLVGEAGHFGRW